MRNRTTTLAVGLALVLAGCGGADGDDTAEPAAKQAPPPSAAAADPKKEWVLAVTGLCAELAVEVSGRQLSDFTDDNRYSPDEVLAAERDARPAVERFDAGYAALPVPPEAEEAKKAYDTFLSLSKKTVPALLAAAKAGDQAAMEKVFAAREGVRNGPQGFKAFMPHGLPEKCGYRASYL
jgi:hypothetical protein